MTHSLLCRVISSAWSSLHGLLCMVIFAWSSLSGLTCPVLGQFAFPYQPCPPSLPPSGVRRPKHIVLSDTLSLLSKIRDALKGYEVKVARLTADAATAAAAASGHSLAHPAAEAPAPSPAETGCEPLTAPGAAVDSFSNKGLSRTSSAIFPAAPIIAAVPPVVAKVQPFPLIAAAAMAVPIPMLMALPPPPASALPCAATATAPVGDLQYVELLSLPRVEVLEVAPSTFHISIVCFDHADLRSDIANSLSGLPITLSHASFTPAASAAPLGSNVSSTSSGVIQAELVVGGIGGGGPGGITVEQLQLALYMTVCCSCPMLPPSSYEAGGGMHCGGVDGMGSLDVAADNRWMGLAMEY